MHKRSCSESVQGSFSPSRRNKNSGKLCLSIEIGNDKRSRKRKTVIDSHQAHKPHSNGNLSVSNKHSNNFTVSERTGMVGSLRRTTSISNSGGEENCSTRRRTGTDSADHDSTNKNEPLPDILHDWEIIVKSLQENQNEIDNNGTVEPVPTSNYKTLRHTTLNSRQLLKIEPTDSDKENSLFKKKSSTEKFTELLIPSVSEAKSGLGSDKQTQKLNKIHLDSSPHDESVAVWRRPTRSTYRAFENIFESPDLDIPLVCELNGNDKKDIESVKAVLSPSKLGDIEKPKASNKEYKKKAEKQKLNLEKLTTSLKSLRKNKCIIKVTANTLVKKKRGRPRKLESKDLKLSKCKGKKLIKARHLTGGKKVVSKESSLVGNKQTYTPAEENYDSESKSACRELYIKIENLKIPLEHEMDFLGFGSPPATKKIRLTSPVKNSTFREILEEENLADVLSDSHSDDDDGAKIDVGHEIPVPVQKSLVSSLKKNSPACKSVEIGLSDFESYFGADNDSHIHDFEGFASSFTHQRTCLNCSIVLDSSLTLRQHIKVGHNRIYSCPFELGHCGQWRGSISFHNHLMSTHMSLISFLQLQINSDLQSGKIANWAQEADGCSVCLMPLEQPWLCIHEMLIHGMWPPSLLNLSSIPIDQHVSLWWTSCTQAFACHLCHTPQSVLSRNCTIPIVRCTPHSFPTLLSNHLRNVHLLNLPLFQGWYLMIKLLHMLAASPRRTLATIILLGVDSTISYSACQICGVALTFYSNVSLHLSHGLCHRCEALCQCEERCWFGCCSFILKEGTIIDHILAEHNSHLPGAWCVDCGEWSLDIFKHNLKCTVNKSTMCKFCSFEITTLSLLKKVWHSLYCHVFPCPIPGCLVSTENSEVHHFFPSAFALYSHLLVRHLPEWGEYSLEQMSFLILNSKKNHGVVLTTYSAQHLNGIWTGLSGHRYSLSEGVLTPVEIAKVSLACIVCLHQWEENVDIASDEKGSVCGECSLLFSQCEHGELPPQCPVYRCLKNIASFSHLYEHLSAVHNNLFITKISGCLYCPLITFSSPFASITHNLLRHKIACLLCPITTATVSQIRAHRASAHGLPSWDAVFQHLKFEEFSRNKNKEKEKQKIIHGVVRVWSDDHSTLAQWDPCLKLSELIVHDEDDDYTRVINQQVQENNVFEQNIQMSDMSEFDPWCTSLCSVSMSSPKKFALATVSSDKDIKPDISQMPNKLYTSSDMENVFPELLIPTVSVAENGEIVGAGIIGKASGYDDKTNETDSLDGNENTADRPLEIDSSVQSPDLGSLEDSSTVEDTVNSKQLAVTIPVTVPPAYTENLTLVNNQCTNDAMNSVKEAVKSPSTGGATKTPTFGLVDTLNSVMEETLQSMSQALSNTLGAVNKENENLRISIYNKNIKKADNAKGLGENAVVDETAMAENILKDLEEKYSGTCVECGNSVLLSHLKMHIKIIHPGKMVYCSCGFTAEIYSALVHMFHMSHIPNEARPIVLGSANGTNKIMIVLEAKPDLKTITYPCYKCSKRFKQEKSRQLHYNLCKLEKKFFCEVCGEKFALDNHLQKHKEWKHNPQICKHCNKTFTSSSSLAQHVLHIHKKPLCQRCKQCGDVFNTSKQLKVHSRIHTGEQPHACQHCVFKFISQNLLTKHIAKMHRIISLGEKKVKHYKLNGGMSSSSDSSDSDDSNTTALLTKFNRHHRNDDEIKVMALTESDLNTSSSEAEESTSLPPPPPALGKKTKSVGTARKNVAAASGRPNASAEKGQESKSSSIGIYQDREVVTLPELKSGFKSKVELTVGRVCIPCGQEFDSPTAKLLHMYLIHPGLVLTLGFNECCFCDHSFLSADDVSNHHLDKHQRTALTNSNFRCLCGLVFREDGAYYFHLYYAHKAQRALNIGGEIVCRLCEGRPRLNKIVDLVVHLSDRHTMFDHVRFNDSYMCNFCYKAFESWTVLSLHFFMVHKATKSQTLSYDCPYCQGASPWHSLEALQYHLDNVHRGRHTQSRPVPEHSRSIYTPAQVPSSPTKKKDTTLTTTIKSVKPIRVKNLKVKNVFTKKSPKLSKIQKNVKSKRSSNDHEVLYCICQCPYDEVSDMIGCDNTNCRYQWFHFECVGIMSAPEGNWYCPDCTNLAHQKQKQAQKQNELQADLYEYYSSYSNDAAETDVGGSATEIRSRHHSTSSNSSNSSNSSSSSSSNTSSTSSSSSGESSSGSGDEN